MNTIDFIKSSLQTSRSATLPLILDLKDQPLAQATTKGGNHAHWILGHLVYIESTIIQCIMLGNEKCPHEHLKPLFEVGSQPCTKAEGYPSFDELLSEWEKVRAFTLQTLASFTEDDLDKPSAGCPEEWAAWFGTIGKVFTTQIIHATMHYGQLSDIRKSLGRQPIMA
jgi:hypothetical protein